MVERFYGIEEVRGSNPLRSTTLSVVLASLADPPISFKKESMAELTIKCVACGQEFVFSEGEQVFYRTKGLTPPKYCIICRAREKAKERDISKYQK